MQKFTNELKFTAGSLLELIVLKMLSRRSYSVDEIYNSLKEIGFKTPKGSIYPLINRLRKNALIACGREESETGRKMMTYELTEKGRLHLKELRSDWNRLNSLIARLGS